ELDEPLEVTEHTLRMQVLVIPGLVGHAALALDAEEVAGHRHGHVLLAHAGHLDGQHQRILRLVHVHGREPRAHRRRSGHRTAEERLEQTIHLTLDIAHVAERLPPIRGPEGTPMLHRHLEPLLEKSAGRTTGAQPILSTHVIYQLSVRLSNTPPKFPTLGVPWGRVAAMK